MLNFFRKIRRKLSREGQMRKYLLYAGGEILLIIIGILIALQIDNWNTSRMEARELEGYLSNIAENIRSDMDRAKAIKDFRDSAVAYSEKTLDILKNKLIPGKKITARDFEAYYPEEISIFSDRYFHADQSGFDALKSAGYLGKIQGTDLETILYEYYNTVEEIEEQEKSLNEFIENLQVLFYSRNVPQQINRIARIPDKQAYIGQHQEEVRQLMSDPTFTGANIRNAISPRILLPYYDELIRLGEEIVGRIEKQEGNGARSAASR